jgi:hypothetical protein
MQQQKWFKTDCDLVMGALVYFIKKDSVVGDGKGSMGKGMVEKSKKGWDGVLREVVIKYYNASEQTISLMRGNAKEDSTHPSCG